MALRSSLVGSTIGTAMPLEASNFEPHMQPSYETMYPGWMQNNMARIPQAYFDPNAQDAMNHAHVPQSPWMSSDQPQPGAPDSGPSYAAPFAPRSQAFGRPWQMPRSQASERSWPMPRSQAPKTLPPGPQWQVPRGQTVEQSRQGGMQVPQEQSPWRQRPSSQPGPPWFSRQAPPPTNRGAPAAYSPGMAYAPRNQMLQMPPAPPSAPTWGNSRNFSHNGPSQKCVCCEMRKNGTP